MIDLQNELIFIFYHPRFRFERLKAILWGHLADEMLNLLRNIPLMMQWWSFKIRKNMKF